MERPSEIPSVTRLRRALDGLGPPHVRNPYRPEAAAALLAETTIEVSKVEVRWDGADVVVLTATTHGQLSGKIHMATYPADAVRYQGALIGCWRGLETIQRQLRREGDEAEVRLCAVEQSHVHDAVRGAGLGISLYIAAAREARQRFHAAITSHRCVGGVTSVSANRVWTSDRFRREVRIAGKVGWWVGAAPSSR